MESDNKRNLIITFSILAIALILGTIVAISYISFRYEETYFAFTEGETLYNGNKEYRSKEKLGKYSPNLSSYGADTTIYIIAGEDAQKKYEENGNYQGCTSALILGGTHANEPSGQLTATIFLENAHVSGNTVLFIITETNRSAFSYSFPQEGAVTHYTLTTRSGETRTFKYGTRATNPVDQWPNPDIYTVSRTLPNGKTISTQLSSTDSRNINRAYGVDEPVTYTEKVAKGITNLIKINDIKVTFDLHEASPEYQTINAIVYHNSCGTDEKYNDVLTSEIAVKTSGNMLSDSDVTIGQNVSPESLRGLTHIELGTFTDTLCFLCETSNASQGKLRGAFTEELVTYEGDSYEGDLFYERFNNTRILYANAVSLTERVARHTMTILEILNQYNTVIEDYDSAIDKTKTTLYRGLSEDRINVLYDENEVESSLFDISLSLYEDNATGKNHVSDEYDIYGYELALNDPYEPIKCSPKAVQAYDLITKYSVGYFLKDEIK